ncbi:hypothetical protein GCM10020229_45740 [Kitasatospora albolonga]|uniref:hypothetical protein n=1 Tax=Kitasatospora albolonga TaxID=68173 RepID=UPI0031E5DD88
MSAAVHSEPMYDANGRSTRKATAEDFKAMAKEFKAAEDARRAKGSPPVSWVDPDSFEIPAAMGEAE